MNASPHRLPFLLAAVATALAPVCASLRAAAPAPLVTGLTAPTKTFFSINGNLLVAEAGTGPNTGRLSVITGEAVVGRPGPETRAGDGSDAHGTPDAGSPSPQPWFERFRWDYFSVVQLGYSLAAPDLHRASCHQYNRCSCWRSACMKPDTAG